MNWQSSTPQPTGVFHAPSAVLAHMPTFGAAVYQDFSLIKILLSQSSIWLEVIGSYLSRMTITGEAITVPSVSLSSLFYHLVPVVQLSDQVKVSTKGLVETEFRLATSNFSRSISPM
jgi:hypothetical protein